MVMECWKSANRDYSHLYYTKEMQSDLQKTIKKLGLSEYQRPDIDLLDRETREYIHSKLDPEEGGLQGLHDVVQRARQKVISSTHFLQQSTVNMNKSVHKLHTFLHAPRGWFLELCLKHEVNLFLAPTFPDSCTCPEVRETAKDTRFLQLSVDEFHVPAQLIVREVRVKNLTAEECDNAEDVSLFATFEADDSLAISETRNKCTQQDSLISHPNQALHSDNLRKSDTETLPLPSNKDDFNPDPFRTQSLPRTFKNKILRSFPQENTKEIDNETVNNYQVKPRHTPSIVCCSRSKSSPSQHDVPLPCQSDLSETPHGKSSKPLTRICNQTMLTTHLEATSESMTCISASVSTPGLTGNVTTDLSEVPSSCQSLQVDTLSFTPELLAKDSSQNARTFSSVRQSHISQFKNLPVDKDGSSTVTNHNQISSRSTLSASIYQNRISVDHDRTSVYQNRIVNNSVTGKGHSSRNLPHGRDVRIVRESKEALVPELSENRVCVRGYYLKQGCEEAIPFVIFFHKDHDVEQGDSQFTLCGSYIRGMLTSNKHLRWRFRHTFG